MKLLKLLLALFFTTTIFSQTKFEEMKKQYCKSLVYGKFQIKKVWN